MRKIKAALKNNDMHILERTVREGLPDEVSFEQKLE